MSTVAPALTVPDEIAEAVILPESYERFVEVVLPAARWLRENMPVGRAKVDGYDSVWLVSSYDDIRAITKDAETFHNADLSPVLHTQADDEFTRTLTGDARTLQTLTYMDPPEHPAYRQPLNEPFSASTIRRRYETLFSGLASQVVDELMDTGGECDFIQDFAAIYPMRVTMAMLGVPPADHLRLLELTREWFGAGDPERQRDEFKGLPEAQGRQWLAAFAEFNRFFEELRDCRRENPRDDVTTLINQLAEGDGQWPDEIANGFLAGLAPAGIHTTASAVAGGLIGLIRFPDQFELVKSDLQLIPGLVDEAIRWTTPTKHMMRNATRDTQLRGVPIKAMDRVCMLLFSGNRDPNQFPDPDRFDITRSPNRHLALGHGPHICIGQHVAKLEMRILFSELVPRLESLELMGEPEREYGNLVSNWRTLPIRFTGA